MEQLKTIIHHASLKKLFTYMVLCTVFIILILSGLTIWGCAAFQSWLLPDSDLLMLHITTTYADGREAKEMVLVELNQNIENESSQLIPFSTSSDPEQEVRRTFRIDKIENSYSALTPKRKLAYTGCSVLMAALPLLYSIAGIVLCSILFYQWKLNTPLCLLSDAADNIARQNLDFSIAYNSSDEMGALCASFEKMREALVKNNQKLWNMLAERKLLQASVAHDLRNPIAIIEGYTEYLSLNIPAGTITEEKTLEMIGNLQQTARRMEVYTDSIRDINRFEELELHPVFHSLPGLLNEITDSLTLMAAQSNRTVHVTNTVTEGNGMVDTEILYRILENTVSNALRYAVQTITLSFSLRDDSLVITISDDGPGFPEKYLKRSRHQLPSMDFSRAGSQEHLGMGIPVSRILAQKHGGALQLANQSPAGAVVTVTIAIN